MSARDWMFKLSKFLLADTFWRVAAEDVCAWGTLFLMVCEGVKTCFFMFMPSRLQKITFCESENFVRIE